MRPSVRTGGTVAGTAVVIGIVALAVYLFAYSGTSDTGVPDLGELPDLGGELTVNEWVDPWTSTTGDGPAPGRRLVAIDVTIENDGSEDYPVFVDPTSFKLTDRDGFVYQPVDSRQAPALPASLQLSEGEKARGWIMFEIAAESEIESLTYWTNEVDPP
jgi:hypothetical protein